MQETFQILLVEDNLGDIKIAQEAFKQSNSIINLQYAQDGVQAINYLKKNAEFIDATTPDLILLDLNLPKKDGKEVLLEIKTDQKLKQIPVIILTTSEADTDINECYLLGANSYITKPMDLESFLKAIRSIEEYWLKTAKLPRNK